MKWRRDTFWLKAPIRSSDPAVLNAHGFLCLQRSDGVGMIQTGWAIYERAGLHVQQADAFIRDGYREWRRSADFDPRTAWEFLNSLLSRLESQDPPGPANPPTASSLYYGVRCWAASEMIDLAQASGWTEVLALESPRFYSAITRSPRDTVPPRSWVWSRAYAQRSGLPEPWGGR